jgi:hypothetical protein
MPGFFRNVIGDLSAMKPPVFNEDLIGVHAGDDYAGQINPRRLAFECGGIGARALSGGIEGNSNRIEKLQVGTLTGERKNEIVP